MKKNFFRVLALSALLFVGAAGGYAQQKSYDVPPLDPECKAMADQVINLNMEDPDAANKVFMKLVKKIGKNKEDLVAVGTYFLDNNNYPAAKQCADRVYDLAPEYVPGLMFSGEVCMIRKDYGGAGQKFDAVLLVDSNNVAALKRNAFVYKNVNPHVAIEALNRIKRLEPGGYAADKELGDIYYKLDQYNEAVSHYDLYYKAVPKDTTKLDLYSCNCYLQSLYATANVNPDNFNRITEIAAELLPLSPKDMIMRRMDFFAKVNKIADAMDYDGAVKAAEDASAYVVNHEYSDSSYIYLDYEYAAALAKEKNDVPAAIEWYKKALAIDGKKASGYKELSTLYGRNKQAELGIEAYNKYLELMGDKVDVADRYVLGTKYMAAYQEQDITPEKKAEYFKKADDTFAAVIAENPENKLTLTLTYLQRARLNNTDAQKPIDVVKDYYQKVLESSESVADRTKAQRFEACRYLFFYYVSIEPANNDEARKVLELAKSIDPSNAFIQNGETYLNTVK